MSKQEYDEDDLDDLDELLDQFDISSRNIKTKDQGQEATKLSETASNTEAAASSKQNSATIENDSSGIDPDELLEDDFVKQLEMGMEDLMKEIQSDPEAKNQFENLVRGIGDFSKFGSLENKDSGEAEDKNNTNGPKTSSSSKTTDALQDTISRTMERMKESNEQMDQEMSNTAEEEFLATMLKQLEGSTGSEGGLDSDSDLSRMLAGMMEQLTSKDILYEPMKELDNKYDEWIDQNKTSLNQQDLERYQKQKIIVREIVVRFELPSYSDNNDEDRKYITQRMQKMQESGSPPPDIIGDLGSAGFGFNDSGIGDLPTDLDNNCGVQ
ncbi:Pex19 protein family-domain-containing protein [Dipodascopsis uninucleata]